MTLRTKIALLPLHGIARFAAVVAIAMAAGHLAQTLAARKHVRVAEAVMLPTHIVQLSSEGAPDPVAGRGDPELHMLALERPSLIATCPVDLTLSALPAAMISATLTAPCRQGERVVLRQARLAITDKIGADGRLTVTLPALTVDGDVAVLFADGMRVQHSLAMPEAANLRRFGVQWQGADAFALHAIAQDSDFNRQGDIWEHNPGTLQTGFMTVLGNPQVENPLLAQIYTYPPSAVPQIVLEAAVLPETCGHDLLGEVLTAEGGQVQAVDLTLAMPECSAIGDYLVLKNLASDVKVAAN
ncbi:MAG: hypothetical protein H7245_16465 [Candidatus Saccharibacteria bacterium]|nr:hypothetical protein [Pseudorhodobacter sp.]